MTMHIIPLCVTQDSLLVPTRLTLFPVTSVLVLATQTKLQEATENFARVLFVHVAFFKWATPSGSSSRVLAR